MRKLTGKLAVCGVVCAAVLVARADLIQVALNYNFNGIVHVGEAGLPDDPNGFRSISDRALDFQGGIPSNETLDNYRVVDKPGVLDIVHLGDRTTVDVGHWVFGTAPGPPPVDAFRDWGLFIGIQPDWLPDPDQTGPQTTELPSPITMTESSFGGIIFQISNGGGSFDVRFTFSSGDDVVTQLTGPDWFADNGGEPNIGRFFATGQVDQASRSSDLLLTEGIVDLSAEAGRELVAIGFENRTNTDGGYAVVAVNIEGVSDDACDACDMDCSGDVDAFDIEPFLDLLFGGAEPCCGVRGDSGSTGDTDGDGDIDAFDIEPFLNCLFP